VFESLGSILLSGVQTVVVRVAVTWPMAIGLLVFLSASPLAAQAAAEYGHIATGASASTTAISNKLDSAANKLDSALPQGKKNSSVSAASNQPTVATGTEKSFADANRRALEQSAGQNAATLSLKSLPVKAVVRINGKPVGRTPLQLSLAPGTYKVEMEGPRMEFGKQQLDLRAEEKREIELHLSAAPRYPRYVQLE
jgi:PEGA domain